MVKVVMVNWSQEAWTAWKKGVSAVVNIMVSSHQWSWRLAARPIPRKKMRLNIYIIYIQYLFFYLFMYSKRNGPVPAKCASPSVAQPATAKLGRFRRHLFDGAVVQRSPFRRRNPSDHGDGSGNLIHDQTRVLIGKRCKLMKQPEVSWFVMILWTDAVASVQCEARMYTSGDCESSANCEQEPVSQMSEVFPQVSESTPTRSGTKQLQAQPRITTMIGFTRSLDEPRNTAAEVQLRAFHPSFRSPWHKALPETCQEFCQEFCQVCPQFHLDISDIKWYEYIYI
jgi:hypothetical protein